MMRACDLSEQLARGFPVADVVASERQINLGLQSDSIGFRIGTSERWMPGAGELRVIIRCPFGQTICRRRIDRCERQAYAGIFSVFIEEALQLEA